jgi:hypothetical protein
LYVNNQSESGTVANAPAPLSINLAIGDTDYGPGRIFNGIIAGMQVYNTTLTSNQMQQLYVEGLAGMPIPNNGVMGWWPLEGDGSDYSSGGGNVGIPGGTSNAYPASVKSSYMPPGLAGAFQASAASMPMVLDRNGTYSTYNVSVVTWRR